MINAFLIFTFPLTVLTKNAKGAHTVANEPSFKVNKAPVLDSNQVLDDYINNNADQIDQSDGTQNTQASDSTNFLSDATLQTPQDYFGDKTHDISRKDIMDLFHKVQGSHQGNEKELLGILREALRDNLIHNEDGAASNYQKVSDIFNPQDLTNDGSNTDKSTNTDSNTNAPQPTSIEKSSLGGKKFIYDDLKNSDYEFDADFKGPAKEFEISSNDGIVKINGIGSKDTMSVKNSGTVHEVSVFKNGSTALKDTLIYRIVGNPSKIILNTLPQNVTGVEELDAVFQVGSKPHLTTWPTSADKLTTFVPSGGDGGPQAQKLLSKITDAINDNSNTKWTAAMDYLDSMWPAGKSGGGNFYDSSKDSYPSGNLKNPDGKEATGRPLGPVAIRKVLSALYAYAGNNQAKFEALMTKISPELRLEMSNCLDWASKQNDSSFNSQFPGDTNPAYVAPNPNYQYQQQQGAKEPTPDQPSHLNIPDSKSYVGKTGSQDGDKWNNQDAIDMLNKLPHMQTDNSDGSTEDPSATN